MDELFGSAEFWVAVAFVAFAVIVARFGYRRIVDALDMRAAGIKHELDEAVLLREEAQALLAEYQRKQRDAVDQAEEIVEHAKAEAERLARKAEQDLEADMARRRQLAADKITQAEAEAVAEVRNAAATLAIDAARRLIRDTLDDKGAAKLIDDSIGDVPKKLH